MYLVFTNFVFFYSLDVEGSELAILKTIPFDKVDIKVIDIEYKHIGKLFPGTYLELKTFLEVNGYEFAFKIDDPLGYPNDVVFVKKGFIQDLLSED